MDAYINAIDASNERAKVVSDFLVFLSSAQEYLKNNPAARNDEAVKVICEPVEEHYIDDQNKPAMYQRFESALYDGASELATFWRFLSRFDRRCNLGATGFTVTLTTKRPLLA